MIFHILLVTCVLLNTFNGVVSEGAPPHFECNKPVPKQFRAICGSDHVIYSNEALFECAQEQYPDLVEKPIEFCNID